MTGQTLEAIRVEPADPRFGAALLARGAAHWADPAFPYALAGAGTAARGAAAAPEALEEDLADVSGNGHQPEAEASAEMIAGPGAGARAEAPATGAEPPGAGAGAPPPEAVAAVSAAVYVLSGQEPGAIGVIVRPGYLEGEPVLVALLRDLALPPDEAGARVLLEAALGFARERGARVAAAGSRTGDAPAPGLAAGFGDVPAFRKVADFRAVRVVPALWRLEEPEYKVLGATKTEVPALAYMLDYYRQGLALAAPVDEAAFVAGIDRCPNLKVGDFRIARYKTELAAMVAVWEPGAALPVSLAGPGPAEALMAGLGKVLGRFSPCPRLPGAGGALRVRFVRNFAAKQGHPTVFKYLVDRVANEARKAGAHAFEVVLPAGDELLSQVRGQVRRVRNPSVWAAALAPDIDLGEMGPVDPNILDPGF
ncbi:MAG: hypothetical protein FJZ01_14930 [Candidatus Sericytochromatia bacterium]|nr:hypothetical protein [Candidatus Tanganyikabacteria bacterium]